MLVGYMRVSSETDRQVLDLQYDALIQEGVDPRHIFKDKASGAKDNREGLKEALNYLTAGDCLISLGPVLGLVKRAAISKSNGNDLRNDPN